MADGTPHFADATQDRCGAPKLADSLGSDRRLVAECAVPTCRRTAACDPAPWFAEGLGALPLTSFQTRLRCVCGSRQARLAIWPGAFVRPERPDIHVFR